MTIGKSVSPSASLSPDCVSAGKADQIGDWAFDFSHATAIYMLEKGPGNKFAFICGVTSMTEQTYMELEIAGQGPKPFSNVRAITDEGEFQIDVGEDGFGETDSHASSDNFKDLWRSLRRNDRLTIVFDEGPSITFRARGGRKALDEDPCTTTFEVP